MRWPWKQKAVKPNREQKKQAQQNQQFAERIMSRHALDIPRYYWGNLVYRRVKRELSQTYVSNSLSQTMKNFFDRRMKQYEKKYYRIITNQDGQRLLSTVREIYSRPEDKKQFIYLLNRLGVVTQGRKEWQENIVRLQRYEEEITLLKKQMKQQEEYLIRWKHMEVTPQSTTNITREVMQNIKREIRLERLRCGTN